MPFFSEMDSMKTNGGTVDRVLPTSVGLALITASLSGYIGALGMDWHGAAGNLAEN